MQKSIAFFSPIKFSKKLGATKNRIEFGDALSKLGWKTYYIGPAELEFEDNKFSKRDYSEHLKNYLIKNAGLYDVILYEYDSLPFERSLFHSKTLFVARPALLKYHSRTVKAPVDFLIKLKSFLKTILITQKNTSSIEAIEIKSLNNCDLIQVQNSMDQDILSKKFPNKRILKIPNGIGEDRFNTFQKIEKSYKTLIEKPVIAFVGTFDYRKGAKDIKYFLKNIVKKHPNVVFKLIGTKGMFQTKEEVLNYFPIHLRKNLLIIPEFDPLELPHLLNECHLGIFPSYRESFGFGALEMMCSGLPVIAYASAGPCDFILKDLLVDIGNKELFLSKIYNLLKSSDTLKEYSKLAKIIAEDYQWIKIASTAEQYYNMELERL